MRAGDLLLVVDDAHDLDILSATLVYQLALAGTARMIVTARGPDFAATRGHRGAVDRRSAGSHRHRGARRADRASPADVDEFIAELPAPARAVLDYLARRGAAVGRRSHHPGRRRRGGRGGGLGRGGDPGARRTTRPTRSSTRRTRCSPNERAPRSATTAPDDGAPSWSRLLSQHPSDHLSDRLRLASLALDSDAPQPVAEVIERRPAGAAAGRPRRSPNGWPARRWSAPATWRRGCRWRMPWRSRAVAAKPTRCWPRSTPPTLSEPELMAWTLLRAANQFFMLGEPERATAFLQTIRNRVTGCGPAHHPGRAERHLRDERRQRRAMPSTSPARCWRRRRPTTRRWPGRPARPRCARRGRAVSTTSSRWRSARWTPSIPGCCASRSAWARPPRC